MLAGIVTLLVAIGTLGLLLNVVFTHGYFGSPPRGDSAMGLIIPFVISFGSAIVLLFAALLCVLRSGSVLRLMHASPFVVGCITLAITFGVVLAACVALACWSEPTLIARSGSTVILMLGWFAGIIGPLLLALGLLCGAWMNHDAVLDHPQALRPLKVVFVGLSLIALAGYGLGGIGVYQAMTKQAANRAASLAQKSRAQLLAGASIEQQLALDLASLPTNAPLSSVVTFFPERPGYVKLNAKCRQLLVERVLKVPDLDQAMLVTVGGKNYSDRQGVAEFLISVAIEKLRARQDAWGMALQIAIECDADAMSCRPAWLTETFDGKPDPIGHIQSLLSAVDRFKGLPIHGTLTAELQTLTDATARLNPDVNLRKLLQVLNKAGYQPVPQMP